jgi:phytoene dehydrogenase-like protein
MADYDAIIVGAGHNGLVCALYLARAGWRVIVLEAAAEIGGGLRSGAVTRPGFCHDRYATNVGLFAASPVYRELKADFDKLGVRLLRCDKSYASVHGRRALRVYTDHERTQAEFGAIRAGDAEGWRRLTDFYKRTTPHFLPLFFTELPSVAMWGQISRIVAAGLGDAMRLAKLAGQTSRGFAADFMQSPEARGLLESWGYHLDFGPDVPGGAVFAFVAALSAHVHGMPIAEGGAGRITAALRTMIEQAGGRIVTGAEVTRVVVKGGRAVAVRTRVGDEIANVTTRNLFDRLLSAEELAPSFLARVARYRYGPGTFIIHLALERMPHWSAADDLAAFNYIHLNGSETEIADTYRQSLRGFLPARPLLVVSQTTPIDPSRAPPGRHVMRIHVRTVPARIGGDAAGQIGAGNWRDAREAFTERILDLVEQQAPDLRDCIIGIATETPDDIERENPNFVGGDCVSGSHHLNQNFFCRPFLGWSRYVTPVAQLYMVGASTWPGGGVNAGSGYLLARRLIEQPPALQPQPVSSPTPGTHRAPR